MKLPAALAWRGPTTFDLKNSKGVVMATTSVDPTGLATFTLAPDVAGRSNVEGTFFFQTEFIKKVTQAGSEKLVFNFGGTLNTVPVNSGPSGGGGSNIPTSPYRSLFWASHDNENRTKSGIRVPALSADAQTVVVTDTPGLGLEIDCTPGTISAVVGPYDSDGNIVNITNYPLSSTALRRC